MSYVGVIAAGGSSRRTGLGAYTTKAALPLAGKTLLAHNLDFLRRSGVDRAFVVCRADHARLLGSLLSDEDRRMAAFAILPPEGAAGWAGTVERAMAFVDDADEIVLLPCDNYQTAERAEWLDGEHHDMLFTYTQAVDGGGTDGPVFGCSDVRVWSEQSGKGFAGDIFTGYIVARGGPLRTALRTVEPSVRGEKEMTSVLAALTRQGPWRPVLYGGEYVDVVDLDALARLDASLRHNMLVEAELTASGIRYKPAQIGAGVLLHDRAGRVLLTERQDDLGWVMPGGLVDKGEVYVHAAARELREEIGVEVDKIDLRLLGVYPTIGKHGGPACSVIFHALGDPSPLHVDAREVRDARWFDCEGAARITVPFALRGAIEDWFSGRELDVRPVRVVR